MSGIHFQIDVWMVGVVVIAALCLYFLYKRNEEFEEPSINFPDAKHLPKQSGRPAFAQLSAHLLWSALILFMIAFINPTFYFDKEAAVNDEIPKEPPKEGIAIYLVLDQSGSMREKVFYTHAKGEILTPKIDLVRELTKRFIEGDSQLHLSGRPNDMIGLIYFARSAQVISPLTLDHAALLSKLEMFDAVPDREMDGTSIGYGIFKAANLMAATSRYGGDLAQNNITPYTIKSRVMIVITDGLQDPNPLDKGKRLRNMDIPEAAAYAKKEGIKLYIVNVEPKLADEKYAPHRHIMQRAAESTGGKFYMVDQDTPLENIYMAIDQLEKSLLPPQPAYRLNEHPEMYIRMNLYPYFIALGMCCLFLSLILDAAILRKVP